MIQGRLNESAVLKITTRINDYEKYLGDMFRYFRKYYMIEEIGWLKQK